MRRGFLVVEEGEKGKRRVPVLSSIIIGRSADCDVTLDNPAASRHHVEIVARDNNFFWKDLGSTNGTVLNGKQMLEGVLQDGDELQIGETVMHFEIEVVMESAESEESTLFKTLITASGESVEQEGTDAHAEDLLRAVYTVMNQIASNFEPCSLVDEILETSIKAIDGQRGAVFFAGADREELLPCPECGKYHMLQNGRVRHVNWEGVEISRTVAHRVLSRGESVLLRESDLDGEDLKNAQSIVNLNLRSIMCVPLRGKYGILGLYYVDSNRPGDEYSREDMLLATAVGNSAGLALENARMHQQVVEKERIEQDIEHAWTIQEGFLFKDWPEEDPRFAVYGETKPAKIVGGDFYDFVQPREDRVGLLIGDVSGKGVPASLTMAQLLAEFRLCARQSDSPSEILGMLNQQMYVRSLYGTFCTLCYVSLDLANGKILCANAGHHAPLCVGDDVEEFGKATGPPLGVLPEYTWSNTEFQMKSGQTVLLYTDGIVEARGLHTRRDSGRPSDEFGVRNLKRVALGFREESPREMLNGINMSVREYTAPALPHDDCTLIALHYTVE